MAFVHAKNTVIKVSGTDISAYTNTSNFEKNADKHDTTTYGKDAHVFAGGLLNGAMGFGGIYDSTATTGPRALLEPLVGTNVTVIRRPEGTGSGKPQGLLRRADREVHRVVPRGRLHPVGVRGPAVRHDDLHGAVRRPGTCSPVTKSSPARRATARPPCPTAPGRRSAR
jgi:hypothetical protein